MTEVLFLVLMGAIVAVNFAVAFAAGWLAQRVRRRGSLPSWLAALVAACLLGFRLLAGRPPVLDLEGVPWLGYALDFIVGYAAVRLGAALARGRRALGEERAASLHEV